MPCERPIASASPLAWRLVPLPINELKPTGSPYHILAGQKGSWELRYRPEHGLEWILGGEVLEDAHFDPARCNAIVLTGYLQPTRASDAKSPTCLTT